MKLELEEILTIVDKVRQADLAIFSYRDEDIRIKIKGKQKENTIGGLQGQCCISEKDAEREAGPKERKMSEAALYIESPMVGTFYAAPSEDAAPFVQVGDLVRKGQTVAIVEAMKLMNEIEAECDGIVEEILVKNEQLVEYGQPLIRFRQTA